MAREEDVEKNSKGLYETICEKIALAENKEIQELENKKARLFCQDLEKLSELYEKVSSDLIKNQQNGDIHIKLPDDPLYEDKHFIGLKNSSIQKIGHDCVRVKKNIDEYDYDGWDSFEYVEGYTISFRCWKKNLPNIKKITLIKEDYWK
jgi:hypothetical protein